MMKRFTSRFYYGWLIVAVLTVANFTQVGEFNPVLAVFVKPFGDEFGWSRAEVALAITLGSFGGGLIGPLVGPVIDRYGSRAVLVFCQLLYGTCLLSLTFLQGSILQFLVAYSLGRMVVQGGSGLAGQAAIANWFIVLRGKAMGISILGTRLGQAILPALVVLIIETWHWRYAWLMLGLSALLLAVVPTLLFLRRRPEDLGLLPDGAIPSGNAGAAAGKSVAATPTVALPEPNWTPREVLRNRGFWCLVAASSLSYFVGAGVNLHLYPYLTDSGLSVPRAVTIASLFFGIGAISSVVWGALLDRFPLRTCLALDFCISAIGLVLLLRTDSFAPGLAFSLIYGLSFGGLHTMMSVMFAIYFGRRHVGAISGLSLPIQLTVNALGPLWAGWIYDIQGSYQLAFSVFVGCALAAALVTWAAGPPRLAPAHRVAAPVV